MISTNSLSAFTPDIMLPRLPGQVGAAPPLPAQEDEGGSSTAPPPPERRLSAAPEDAAPPARLPRGSLVDLRI